MGRTCVLTNTPGDIFVQEEEKKNLEKSDAEAHKLQKKLDEMHTVMEEKEKASLQVFLSPID